MKKIKSITIALILLFGPMNLAESAPEIVRLKRRNVEEAQVGQIEAIRRSRQTRRADQTEAMRKKALLSDIDLESIEDPATRDAIQKLCDILSED